MHEKIEIADKLSSSDYRFLIKITYKYSQCTVNHKPRAVQRSIKWFPSTDFHTNIGETRERHFLGLAQ